MLAVDLMFEKVFSLDGRFHIKFLFFGADSAWVSSLAPSLC